MQKWEYCYLEGVYLMSGRGFSAEYPIKRTFTTKPPYLIKEDLWDLQRSRKERIFGIAELIAKMGREGWELVSLGREGSNVMFFKRPIEEESS